MLQLLGCLRFVLYALFFVQVQYFFALYQPLSFSLIHQESWHNYDIDFEGPVPLDDDEHSVVVQELPHLLSEEERTTLRQQISQPDSTTGEWMVQSYAVTRSIIHALSESQ